MGQGSVPVFFVKLHHRGEKGRKGRECKFPKIAHRTFDIINSWPPVDDVLHRRVDVVLTQKQRSSFHLSPFTLRGPPPIPSSLATRSPSSGVNERGPGGPNQKSFLSHGGEGGKEDRDSLVKFRGSYLYTKVPSYRWHHLEKVQMKPRIGTLHNTVPCV